MKRIKFNKLPEHLDEAHVYVCDENHFYAIEKLGKGGVEPSKLLLNFIKGGRNTNDCQPGILDAQLVEILIHRLSYFDEQFNTTENQQTIAYLLGALDCMNDRTIDRHERGVLGNNGEDYNEK